METQIRYTSLADLAQVASAVIDFGKDTPVWLFEGNMGVGKTTLIKAICQQWQVSNHVQSPTFSLVNEYITATGQTVYHFDFYRIKNEYEALDMGVEEYFDSGNYCLVEWPSKIENLLPLSYVQVTITVEANGERLVNLVLTNA